MEISTGACLEITVCGTVVVMSGFFGVSATERVAPVPHLCVFSHKYCSFLGFSFSGEGSEEKTRENVDEKRRRRGEGRLSSCRGEKREI
jgi:hypothetical protein